MRSTVGSVRPAYRLRMRTSASAAASGPSMKVAGRPSSSEASAAPSSRSSARLTRTMRPSLWIMMASGENSAMRR
jgi:hypothetical protein